MQVGLDVALPRHENNDLNKKRATPESTSKLREDVTLHVVIRIFHGALQSKKLQPSI
jgi:hypothetical protein